MASSTWRLAEEAVSSALDVGIKAADEVALRHVGTLCCTEGGRYELVHRFDWGGNSMFLKASAFGLVRTVRLMLNEGVARPEHRNIDGVTAEALATANGHASVVEMIRNPDLAVVEEKAEQKARVFGALDSLVSDTAGGGTGKVPLQHVFRELDKDRSGKIAKEEMAQGLEILGIKTSAEEFDDLWDHMDGDGSGEVGFREFKSVLTHFRAFDRVVLHEIQSRIKERLVKDRIDLTTLLAPHDTNGAEGEELVLDNREFRAFLRTDMGFDKAQLPDAEVTRLTRALDRGGQLKVAQIADFVEHGTAALWGANKSTGRAKAKDRAAGNGSAPDSNPPLPSGATQQQEGAMAVAAAAAAADQEAA